jgi:hypothetical protein
LRQTWQIVYFETEYTSSCNMTANGALCDNVYTFTKVFFTFEIFIWFYSAFVKVIPGNHIRKVLLSLRSFSQNSYMYMCVCVQYLGSRLLGLIHLGLKTGPLYPII